MTDVVEIYAALRRDHPARPLPRDMEEWMILEVTRLRAEVSYLRACVPPVHPGDYGHEAWAGAVRAEVDAERAAVVAFLRTRGGIAADLADDIERGDHRREE